MSTTKRNNETQVFFFTGFGKIFSHWWKWFFCQYSEVLFRKPIILDGISLFVLHFLFEFVCVVSRIETFTEQQRSSGLFFMGFGKIFSNWWKCFFCQYSEVFFGRPIILDGITLFVLRFLFGFVSV